MTDTRAIVKRIDARDVKRGKRQREIDKQEKCWAFWETGRQKIAVKSGVNAKVSHKDVFAYFKGELKAIGVKSEEAFHAFLRNRTKRYSRLHSH